MTSALVQSPDIQTLLDRVSGLTQANGDPRLKRILRRVVEGLYAAIDEFDVAPEEFWRLVSFLQEAAPEFGLIAPGLGFDHVLDVRMDLADKAAGADGGTPRTIEGPLYVAGAPLTTGKARLDDGTDKGETLIMAGRVLAPDGQPIAGAIVDVWHANSMGAYSHFDPSQSPYNNRRRIRTDADGRYEFQSVLPAGYAVPPQGATERLLGQVGRHGQRPAHIHFFVSAGGYRHLTTQINIDGDPYLHDDFAYATRDGLIPAVTREEEPEQIRNAGLNAPYSKIAFDFVLTPAARESDTQLSSRPRVDHA